MSGVFFQSWKKKIKRDGRKLLYIDIKNNLHILMFSFSFFRAERLMSAQQLAAKIKALFRDGKVQMEQAAVSCLKVLRFCM